MSALTSLSQQPSSAPIHVPSSCKTQGPEATGFKLFIERTNNLENTWAATKAAAEEHLRTTRILQKTVFLSETMPAKAEHQEPTPPSTPIVPATEPSVQPVGNQVPEIKLWTPQDLPERTADKNAGGVAPGEVYVGKDYRYPWETLDVMYEQRKKREKKNEEMEEKWKVWKLTREWKLAEALRKKKSLERLYGSGENRK